MIELKGATEEILIATQFGRRVAQLYIDPSSAVILRDSLLEAEKKTTKEFSFLHAISRTSELRGLYLRRGDFDEFLVVFYENLQNLLAGNLEAISHWDKELILSEVKMASFLSDWIKESSEEMIREKYHIAPGDVRNKVEIAVWLLYSMRQLGRLFSSSKLAEIGKLEVRVKQGVKEELLELVSLRGIGRVRARMLHRSGYKTLSDVKKADVTALARVKTIGEKIAASIVQQAQNI